MQKSTVANKQVMEKNRKWYIIDATNLVLGDLAVLVANILRGKNKPIFTPNVDCGDYVIVQNAKNVKLTGDKLNKKKYYTHSMYIGGLRTRSAKEMLDKYPEELVFEAIKGMVPKTRLGSAILKKLFVYGQESNQHHAQSPIAISLDGKEIK